MSRATDGAKRLPQTDGAKRLPQTDGAKRLPHRAVVGTLGEQAAAVALADQGYRILHRNYRVRLGELDIVCEKNGILVFCEVKTRTSVQFGLPEEAITIAKRRRLRKLALEYLQREGRRARVLRFDVISVAMSEGRVAELRHLVNAF